MWLEPAEGYDRVIFRAVSWKQVYHWPAEVGPAGCSCQAEQLQSAAEDLRLHLLWINFPLHRQWEHGTAAKERRRLGAAPAIGLSDIYLKAASSPRSISFCQDPLLGLNKVK